MPRTDFDQVFVDGVAVLTVQRVVSDEELDVQSDSDQLLAAMNRLSTIATQADAVAAQPANVSQAQLKQLFSGVSDIARIVRRLARRSVA